MPVTSRFTTPSKKINIKKIHHVRMLHEALCNLGFRPTRHEAFMNFLLLCFSAATKRLYCIS